MSVEELDISNASIPFSGSRQELLRWRIMVSAGLFIPFAGTIFALIRLWRSGPVWSELAIFGFMLLLTGFGITVGYHRLLTHRSFTPPRWLYLTFAVLGSMSLIGPAAVWVATHRRHHAFADRDGDPHSPYEPHEIEPKAFLQRWRGIVHGYVGWLYTPDFSPLERWAPDLMKDAAIMAIDRFFLPLAVVSIVIPGLMEAAVTHSLSGFFGGILWGGLVRVFVVINATLTVNTFCHVYGDRHFKNNDHSANLWPLVLLSLGECWHNNHHALPSAAISGIGWRQLDISGLLIRFLEFLGLAHDVKRPSPEVIAKRRA